MTTQQVLRVSTVSNDINEYLNDDEKSENECGYEIQDYYFVSVHYSGEIKIKCKHCRYENRTNAKNKTNKLDGFCDGCFKYEEYNDITGKCKRLQFEIDDCKEVEYGDFDDADLSKIKINMIFMVSCYVPFVLNLMIGAQHHTMILLENL